MKLVSPLVLTVLLLASSPYDFAQGQGSRIKLGPAFCSMEPGSDNGSNEVESNEPDAETVAMIGRIVKVAGVQQNFVVQAYARFNAEAQIVDEGDQPRRYIFYNRRFLDSIRESGGSEWADIGIMAHEVAHHLNGHTIEHSFSTRELELAADKSAGFWMGRMGATLAEAQSGFSGFPDIVPPNSSHPRRKDRLEAVKAGWDESGGGKPKSELEGVTGPRSDDKYTFEMTGLLVNAVISPRVFDQTYLKLVDQIIKPRRYDLRIKEMKNGHLCDILTIKSTETNQRPANHNGTVVEHFSAAVELREITKRVAAMELYLNPGWRCTY